MRKKVIQLIGSFHQGGSERQAVSLTRSLLADGTFEVRLATLNREGVLLADAEKLGLSEIPEFRLTSFYNVDFVRQVRRCAALLNDERIDIVHTHDFYTNIFGMAAASLAGIAVKVASKRETGGIRSRAQELAEKIAFGRANAVVVNAAAVREHLIERSIPAAKIQVIHNGVDMSRFEVAGDDDNVIRERLGLPFDVRLITLVANLRHTVKNVPMFLRAARIAASAVPDVHFVIAGEGELEAELRATAAEFGIAERAHFIGRCTDVPGLLRASYACALTSVAEGFSNSILEYMAARKPVVATNVGGAAEVITDGENGYLIESSDADAMAARLIELLNDEEKAFAFGKNGHDAIQYNFSDRAQLSKTLKLYHHTISK